MAIYMSGETHNCKGQTVLGNTERLEDLLRSAVVRLYGIHGTHGTSRESRFVVMCVCVCVWPRRHGPRLQEVSKTERQSIRFAIVGHNAQMGDCPISSPELVIAVAH